MKVEMTFSFELREAAPDICGKFNKPIGTYELLDSDNVRMGFFRDEQHALDFLFGIGSDSGLGDFVIE